MIQENIIINGVEVPILYDKEIYYPFNYVCEKVLLKKTSARNLLDATDEYTIYFKKFTVDYNFIKTGIQETHCISREGLKKYLCNSKIGRLSVDQKIAMNGLLKYLSMDLVDIEERFIDNLDDDKIKKYSLFIQDCINEVLKKSPNIKWQKCTKCNNYYPYDVNFFSENQNGGNEYSLNTCCKDCQAWSKNRSRIAITHPNNELNTIYKKYGEEVYLMYKNHETINIYRHVRENKRHLYSKLKNKEDYLLIIEYVYKSGWLKEITIGAIQKVCKIRLNETGLNLREIYLHIFGTDIDESKVNTFNKAKNVFFNYLNKNNIKYDSVYNINYGDIFYKCNLKSYIEDYYNNDSLRFICDLNDNKYAP